MGHTGCPKSFLPGCTYNGLTKSLGSEPGSWAVLISWAQCPPPISQFNNSKRHRKKGHSLWPHWGEEPTSQFHLQALVQGSDLKRRQGECISKQCWSRCGHTHHLVSALVFTDKLSELCAISLQETSSSSHWHQASHLRFLGTFQFLGSHCFNSLTIKGRGTRISL